MTGGDRVCPNKSLPTLSHLVTSLYPSRKQMLVLSDTCLFQHQHTLVISTDAESGFLPEDHILQTVTLQLVRGQQKSNQHCL
ncbi:hypothetical protein TNCV_2268901 [Trichonephila clavipes]|nr:hypothetical protein TNCV_2268901 [Trichonephila clavipes]